MYSGNNNRIRMSRNDSLNVNRSTILMLYDDDLRAMSRRYLRHSFSKKPVDCDYNDIPWINGINKCSFHARKNGGRERQSTAVFHSPNSTLTVTSMIHCNYESRIQVPLLGEAQSLMGFGVPI